jgi:dienelactone hydrolase
MNARGLTSQKDILGESCMTILRILPAIFAVPFALLAGPVQAELKKGWIEYTHGDARLKGYLVHDGGVNGKRPAVLMMHAREGMTDKTLRLTELWASLGYVAFTADIFGYGQGILPKTFPEREAQTAIYTKDRALMRARAQAGFDTLIGNSLVDTSRVALIGYCFGGTVGVEFGATGVPLLANIAIHGSFHNHPAGWAKNVKGRFLILHGAEDEPYPLPRVDEVIRELRAAKVPFQLEVYSGTNHGFSTPRNRDEERANGQSIAATTRTLREVFER